MKLNPESIDLATLRRLWQGEAASLDDAAMARVARAAAVDIEDVQHELAAPAGRGDDALDLDRCLQRLPADQRAVFVLKVLGGTPTSDER